MNKRTTFYLLSYLLFSWISCNIISAQHLFLDAKPGQSFIQIQSAIEPPNGFSRIPADSNSFAAWLRRMPLLPSGSPVLDYRGQIWKFDADSTVAAVLAMNIRGRKLDQCMDILVRMHIEYLLETGKQESIHLPLPDGTFISWQKWAKGWRPVFRGANFQLIKSAQPDASKLNFQKYLNTIFEYSGTQTFYHYYPDVSVEKLKIGDFITKKGRKGHAIMIVDLVENKEGEIMALIGQGDTPACQFYLLQNGDGSPWFKVDKTKSVIPLPIKKKMIWDGLRSFEN